MLKRVISIVIVVSLCCALLLVDQAHAAVTSVWTHSEMEKVYSWQSMPRTATANISWVAAKNEYESAQILIRSNTSFTINSVTFTDLVSGPNLIDSRNFKYYFVEAPISYRPDELSTVASKQVSANTTQPIWVTVYIPSGSAAGNYTGTATVNTTVGNFVVDISLEVNDVTIPELNSAEFSYTNQIMYPNNVSNLWPQYSRYSADWWNVVNNYADSMKEHRMNVILVNPVSLLIDGGTTINNGVYNFNWSKFDEMIEYFIDKSMVKYIEASQICPTYNSESQCLNVQLIKKDANGNIISADVPRTSSEADNWLRQYLPALKAHLQSKVLPGTSTTWFDIYRQHISDESQWALDYRIIVDDYIDVYAPGLKIIDAFYQNLLIGTTYDGRLDTWVPIIHLAEMNEDFFNQKQASGDEIWYYICSGPGDPYFNRFTYQPLLVNRAQFWWCYKFNRTGLLHWAWNQWNFGLADGDGYIVYKDEANNSVRPSIRYENLRDGIEDYELFKILERKDKNKARSLIDELVDNAHSFCNDIATITRVRNELVRSASSNPPPQTPQPVLGQITVDGNDSDWVNYHVIANGSGTIKDIKATIRDGKLYVCARAENLGSGQQIYVDTDCEIYTGYGKYPAKWRTAGAEYLIEGVNVYKYTGNSINPTWSWTKVGTCTISKNQTCYEMAVDISLLGMNAPKRIRIGLVDYDAAFNPLGSAPECSAPQDEELYYMATVDPAKLTVDGNNLDWKGYAATASGSGVVTSLTVHERNSKIYFMASGIGIGVNNNILIDTDNNASTGLKNYLWQNMGCDYMLENGNIYKYTGDGTSWSWILQSSTYLESKNSNVYEACVNIGDINVSSPVRIKAGYYTSDSGNTKIGYAPALGSQIAIVDMSPITVNGGYDDWAGYKPIAPGDNEINNLSAVQKDNNLYLLVKSAAYGINVNNGFLIDTDNNSATGCRFGAWADCGADYLIENSSVYRYAGDGSSFVWQKIGTVSPLRNEWNSVYEVAVPLSMLGLDGPTTIKIGYYTSDSSFKQTGFAPVYQTQMAVCNP